MLLHFEDNIYTALSSGIYEDSDCFNLLILTSLLLPALTLDIL